MDVNATASAEKSKKQKQFEAHYNGRNVDRISSLPDAIIHYILSLLPTKCAVCTGILSKSWMYHWKFIHNLEFSDGIKDSSYDRSSKSFLKKRRAFHYFVDRVLIHNWVPNIQKFTLSSAECVADNFNTWISNIVRCKVQEVILSTEERYPDVFPHCLLTCESLRILKLQMAVSMVIPGSICFSVLKILHLRNVSFSGDQSSEISLSFPKLEEFVLHSCFWLTKTVNISAPTLHMLTIDDYWWGQNRRDCQIKIHADSLVSLKLSTGLSHEYCLWHLPSLVDVFMKLRFDATTIHHLGSYLRGIGNVQVLTVTANSIQILSSPDASDHMPPLTSLIHLRILCEMLQRVPDVRKLIDFLLNTPNIESLSFPRGVRSFGFKGHGRLIGRTPGSFLLHLKLVVIRYFNWTINELWFIRFLIKSVRIVEQLTIKVETVSLKRWDFIEREREKLQILARDWNCVVEFA